MTENNNTSIVDAILELPLFQGMTREQLQHLVEKYPFHFLKYNEGETIVSPGDSCSHARFIISGTVTVNDTSDALKVSVAFDLAAPDILFPEHLFGLDTSYHFSIKSATGCGILQIKKSDFFEILQLNQVFLLNTLNRLSHNIQAQRRILHTLTEFGVKERLALFLSTVTTRRARNIQLKATRQGLASLLGANRNQLIDALNLLADEGIITTNPQGSICINERQELIDLITPKN